MPQGDKQWVVCWAILQMLNSVTAACHADEGSICFHRGDKRECSVTSSGLFVGLYCRCSTALPLPLMLTKEASVFAPPWFVRHKPEQRASYEPIPIFD